MYIYIQEPFNFSAGSITGLEQEAETSNSNTIDQTLLLNSPTSGSLQDIINSNLPYENSFAFHQFDKDLIDSVIHKVNSAMAECLVVALGNQSLSFDDRLGEELCCVLSVGNQKTQARFLWAQVEGCVCDC